MRRSWRDAIEEIEEALREKLQETLMVQQNEPTVRYLQEELYRLKIDRDKHFI